MGYIDLTFGTCATLSYQTYLFQQYPDYYAIIKEPIDLRSIAQKIQVRDDILLSFNGNVITDNLAFCCASCHLTSVVLIKTIISSPNLPVF